MIPTIVYKSPGGQFGPFGKTYDWKPAKDEGALKALLSEGWSLTLAEALEPKEKAVVSEPTRDEMIAFAESSGIKIDKRWSDERLKEAIAKG